MDYGREILVAAFIISLGVAVRGNVVEVPVIVTVLNTPPEIICVEPVEMNSQNWLRIKIRDNNTVADIKDMRVDQVRGRAPTPYRGKRNMHRDRGVNGSDRDAEAVYYCEVDSVNGTYLVVADDGDEVTSYEYMSAGLGEAGGYPPGTFYHTNPPTGGTNWPMVVTGCVLLVIAWFVVWTHREEWF